MNEPQSFVEFRGWLDWLRSKGDFQVQLPAVNGRLHGSEISPEMWLVQYEQPHIPAIESAIARLSRDAEGAISGLPPVPASLLKLRIRTAIEAIEGLITISGCPIDYPSSIGTQELLNWILMDLWRESGLRRAADILELEMLRGKSDPDEQIGL